MSRPDTEGFSIMDVSTAILDDDRFQRLATLAPDRFDTAFLGYAATLARSWRKGRRVSIQQSWPVYRPFDQLAVDALVHVGLIDGKGLIRAATWRQWFEPAQIRRDSTRDRWRKTKATQRNTTDSEHESPRGVLAESSRSPLSRPSVRPSVPTEPSVAGARASGGAPRRFSELVPRPGLKVAT